MNCERCGAPLLINHVCSQCGLEDGFVKKCKLTSDYYYNRGLDKAQIRDLSGAIIELRKALDYNKLNIMARNLLGLCYYEMGEIVSALSEWIVSQNFQEENNDASQYIEAIQSNTTKLDEISAGIRKYNQALNYFKQQNYDLALIQLKRVVAVCPNFVNAHLLLALLYFREDNKEKAKRELKRVLKIDSNNTLALKYFREIAAPPGISRHIESSANGRTMQTKERERKVKKKEIEPSNQLSIDQYVESSNNKYTIVGILVGLLIGIAVMWFLIIPQKSMSLSESYENLKKEYNEELASKNKKVSSLETDKRTLEKEKESLTEELKKYTGDSSGNIFENIMNAAKCYNEGDSEAAAEYLIKVDEKNLNSKVAKQLYNQLSEKILPVVAKTSYNKGYSELAANNFDEAIKDLKLSFQYDDTNVDALYYLGRAYQHKSDFEEAEKIFDQVIDKFPDSRRAAQAKENIDAMGQNQ